VPKQCPDLSTVAGFHTEAIQHRCVDLSAGQLCAVRCADGYEAARGSRWLTMRCGRDGEYSATGGEELAPPMCERQACDVEQLAGRGINVSGCVGVATGTECAVLPEPGYELVAQYIQFHTDVNLADYKTLREATRHNTYTFAHEKLAAGATFFCGASGGRAAHFEFVGPNSVTFVDLKAEKGECSAPQLPEGAEIFCVSSERCYAYCGRGYTGEPRTYVCNAENVMAPTNSPVSCQGAASRRLQQGGDAPCAAAVDQLLAGYTPNMFGTWCHNVSAGENCGIGCNSGFNGTGVGMTLYLCEDNGTLTPITSSYMYGDSLNETLPSCEAIMCSEGFPTGDAVVHDCDDKATFQGCTAECDEGYEGLPENFTCRSDGSFDGLPLQCTLPLCHPFKPGAEYAADNCDGLRTGETCPVECAAGYTRRTSQTSVFTCNATGDFDGTLPVCEPNMCTRGLPADENLEVPPSCDNMTTGQTCTIGCGVGYTGNTTVYTCEAQGLVMGVVPECIAQMCGTMPELGQGVHMLCDEDPTPYLGSCYQSCRDGYTATGNRTLETWTCGASASLDGSVELQGVKIVCDPNPCEAGLPTGDAYAHDCDGVRTGEHCSIACAPGYTSASQNSTATGVCQDSGLLSWPQLTCEKATCAPLAGNDMFGEVCGGRAFGDVCLVTCPSGYDYANGTNASVLQCDIDSNAASGVALQGSLPSCMPRLCDITPMMTERYGTNCVEVAAGGQCEVWCSYENYVPAPNKANITWLNCSDSYQFEGELPGCSRRTTTITSSTSTISSTTTTTTTTTMTMTSTTATSTTATSTTAAATFPKAPGTAGATSTTGGADTVEPGTQTPVAEEEEEEAAYTFNGAMTLTVMDPEEFASNATVLASLREKIASLSGVLPDYVTVRVYVTADSGEARRLRNGHVDRRLAAGSVAVAFEIRVPKSSPQAASMGEVSASILGEAAEGELKRLIEEDPALASHGVEVLSYSAEVRTTTGGPDAGTTAAATPAGDDDDGGSPVGIILGMLVVVAIAAAVVVYMLKRKKGVDKDGRVGEAASMNATKSDGQVWVVGDPAMVRNGDTEEWQAGVVAAVEPVVLVRLKAWDADQPGVEWARVQRPKLSLHVKNAPETPAEAGDNDMEQIQVRVSEKADEPYVAGEFRTKGADVRYALNEVVYVRAHESDKWKEAVVADEEKQLMRLAASPANALATKWPMITRISPPAGEVEAPRPAKSSKASRNSATESAVKRVSSAGGAAEAPESATPATDAQPEAGETAAAVPAPVKKMKKQTTMKTNNSQKSNKSNPKKSSTNGGKSSEGKKSSAKVSGTVPA